MFLQFWLVWAFVGLLFAVWLFYWSIRSRQFENSSRAGLIPFDDVTPTSSPEQTNKGRSIFLTVMTISAFALIASIILIVLLIK